MLVDILFWVWVVALVLSYYDLHLSKHSKIIETYCKLFRSK